MIESAVASVGSKLKGKYSCSAMPTDLMSKISKHTMPAHQIIIIPERRFRNTYPEFRLFK